MRVVFLGTPEFAVPSLRGLAKQSPIVGVVPQPDRPAGRGRLSRPPPVKRTALDLGLPILQPEKIRSPEALAALAAWAPDVIVVAGRPGAGGRSPPPRDAPAVCGGGSVANSARRSAGDAGAPAAGLGRCSRSLGSSLDPH